MIFAAKSLTPARVIGLGASVFALCSCGIAWMSGREIPQRARLPAVIAGLEALLLLDLAFNARELLHDLLAKIAMANHLYAARSGPQRDALGFLAIIVAISLGVALWSFRHRLGACLAVCGAIFSLCCWCAEVISLHGMDRVMYRRVHGVAVVRLASACFAVITGAGLLWDAYAKRKSPR